MDSILAMKGEKQAVPSISQDISPASPSQKRSVVVRLLFQAVCLAWLAPIIVLLVLNLEGYVVGPGLGCPRNGCSLDVFANNFTQTNKHLTSTDHNILGVFQLIAKALELWFFFIACSLVYNLSVLLARRHDGLPMRYLFTYKEFADPMNLGISFWTSALPGKRIEADDKNRTPKTSAAPLCAFVVLIASICVVSNLMGPSTAVLLLPTLGRVKINTLHSRMFVGLDAGTPPISGRDINTGLYYNASCYSCDDSLFPQNLDPMVTAAFAFRPLIMDSGNVQSTINASYYPSADIIWTPLDQALDEIFYDMLQYNYAVISNLSDVNSLSFYNNETTSPSLYETYRSSLGVIVNRQAPVIGFSSNCLLGNVSVIPISDDKSIRCYISYHFNPTYPGPTLPLSDPGAGTSTKCFRVGSGWTETRNDYSQFFITTDVNQPTDLSGDDFSTAAVNIYSTASAIFLNSTASHCSRPINNRSDPSCNWDKMFSEPPPSEYRNVSQNQQIVEYVYPNYGSSYDLYYPGPYTVTWCYSVAYLSFGTYSVDLSVSNLEKDSPEATISAIDITPLSGDPIYVHPDWTLANWAVNRSGVVYESQSSGAVENLFLVLSEGHYYQIDAIQSAITASTLSIVTYDELYNVTTTMDKTHHPILESYATAQAWSYGLSSATSKMGFVAAVLGCLLVCLHSLVGFRSRATGPELVELFVTGLRQNPPKKLAGLKSKEVQKVRFMAADYSDAEFRFV